MTSKAPPIPPDQRSDIGRRDRVTGAQSKQPGDDDVNLKAQGRQGNINQNTHNQGYQQDR